MTDHAARPNHQAWLTLALDRLRGAILPMAPRDLVVVWSLPSRGGTGASARRVIGQCWGGQAVEGVAGEHLLLVSPTIAEPVQIFATILHEMIHATVGIEAGHRRPFSQLARHVGFTRPWTQTPMSEELHRRLEALLSALPPWPGGRLLPAPNDKGRHLKAVCECDPPRILRVSMKTFRDGQILCAVCDGVFDLRLEDRNENKPDTHV